MHIDERLGRYPGRQSRVLWWTKTNRITPRMEKKTT